MVKRYISALSLNKAALLCAALLLCGCAKSRFSQDTLVYAHLGEIVSLDPVYPYDGVSHGTLINVYETLIRFKGSSLAEFEPALSEQVPSAANGLVSSDGLVYRFPIRKGVKFHDGSELTPGDARYSLLRFMLADPAGGPASLLLEPVLGISSTRDSKGEIIADFSAAEKAVRVDGDSVVITLKRPFAPFLAIMARWSYVVSRNWCAANGEWDGSASTWKEFNNRDKEKSGAFEKTNGTGPFMLERWDRKAKRLYLARFDGYWRGPARLKRVMQATVSEFGTRRLMLEAGDADIIEVPRPFEPQLAGMKDAVVDDNLPRLTTDPVFFFTFRINPAGNGDIGSGLLDGRGIPPDFFSDIDVRKAFACSFDYESFAAQSLRGKAVRAVGPIPPGILGYDPSVPHYSFDSAKAEEHFRKAWKGKVWENGFRLTMSYNTGGDVRQLACEMLKKNIEALNPKFKIELRGLDWPSYLDKAQGKKMPVFTRGWLGDYPDPHNFTFPFYHSAGRYPSAQGYKNPELDRLIEAAVREVSPEKRAAMYYKIQALGNADAVQIYTVHPQGLYARRKWLKGFTDNAVLMGVDYYPLYKSRE